MHKFNTIYPSLQRWNTVWLKKVYTCLINTILTNLVVRLKSLEIFWILFLEFSWSVNSMDLDHYFYLKLFITEATIISEMFGHLLRMIIITIFNSLSSCSTIIPYLVIKTISILFSLVKWMLNYIIKLYKCIVI